MARHVTASAASDLPRRRVPRILPVILLATTTLTGCLGGGGDDQLDPTKNADADQYTLTIASNAIAGGKNAAGAKWIEDWVIPKFEAAQRDKGIDATVEFEPAGVDDAEYKSKLGLDFESGKGADIVDIDGIWVGEFADSGFIHPLADVVGKSEMADWDGWDQIPDSVRANGIHDDAQYGIPKGTDGRLLFYNKKLFDEAGLDSDWQPRDWEEILTAARIVESEVPDATPLQINAGTAMGESTTMEGLLPLLAGTGHEIHSDGAWMGDHQAIRDVLALYADVYQDDLGNPTLQAEAQGRQKAQEDFAAGELAILAEGDYFWRDVISPGSDIAPMDDRDDAVGFAMLPAQEQGSGVDGQDFVSMSGGAAQIINPNTHYPQQAWELLRFMNSAEAVTAEVDDTPRITQRQDVNDEVLAGDPLLTFVAEEVVPLTRYRPSDGDYVAVSAALQEATYAVVDGAAPQDAAAEYHSALEDIVGADNITTS